AVADAVGREPDQHLVGPGLEHVHVLDDQGLVQLVQDRRAGSHGRSSGFASAPAAGCRGPRVDRRPRSAASLTDPRDRRKRGGPGVRAGPSAGPGRPAAKELGSSGPDPLECRPASRPWGGPARPGRGGPMPRTDAMPPLWLVGLLVAVSGFCSLVYQ